MKSRFCQVFLLLFSLIIFLTFFPRDSRAITPEECEEKIGKGALSLEELRECESILDKLSQETKTQSRSLEQEIKRFNTAVAITTSRILTTTEEIKKLEEEISGLSTKIGRLDLSLDQFSEILITRITETYKKGKTDTLALLFSSQNFSEFVGRYKYLRAAQVHDRQLIMQMETVRTEYESQKTVKEEKQDDLETAKKNLETQKTLLARQKADKERLLAITQNNEKRYQQLLSASRAEIEAIQRIIAGEGECSEAGSVNQGQKIAVMISGTSACSLGTHLHFEIREGDDVRNPLSYLRNIGLVDDSGGDPHNGTGDWDWPLNEPIKFTQGFGSDTSAIRSHTVWYDFHTGVDIVSDDSTVKAVKTGRLYRCAISCGGGTLRYVRVENDGSNLKTYYLHVNY